MKERKTLLITVATVCIYTAILVGWHLYVPRENLTIQVPGADNRPEGLARKANDVVIGEYFMKYEEERKHSINSPFHSKNVILLL